MGRDRRLFVATGVPMPPAVRQALKSMSSEIAAVMPQARLVPPEKQHVTLAFLGDAGGARSDRLCAALDTAASRCAAFAVTTSSVGGFPSTERARVVWVGFDDPSGGGETVASAIRDALAEALDPEIIARLGGRPLRMHCTLARLDRPRALPVQVLGRLVGPVELLVSGFGLFSSESITGRAARYRCVRTFSLTDR
jgi:2'-5' RNA ligase